MKETDMEAKKFDVPRSEILSWIFKEIQETRTDYVNIVCKDHEMVDAPALLLAALAPNFAEILKSVEIESCVIFLPDVRASSIRHLMYRTFNMDLVSDESVVQDLSEIFWESTLSVKLEGTKGGIEDLLCVDIEENGHDEYIKLEPTEEIIVPEPYYVDTTQPDSEDVKPCRVSLERLTYQRTEETIQEIAKKKEFVERMRLAKERKRQMKIKEEMPSSDDDNCSTEPKKKKKRIRAKEKLRVRGPKLQEKDMPSDPEFKAAQEKLKIALEDPENLTDPGLLWMEYHGISSFEEIQQGQYRYICPICVVRCVQNKRAYFKHIRAHKKRKYACTCPPESITNSSDDHLMLDHWKWERCVQCQLPVFPPSMHVHMMRQHGKKARSLYCEECGKGFRSRFEETYKMHIMKHKAEKFECDCPVYTSSIREKLHHVQKEHLKQMFCCELCFFCCLDQNTMDKHMEKHLSEHQKLKKEKGGPPEVPICDICGFRSKSSKANMEMHKRRKHGELVQCPNCPAKYTEYSLQLHLKRCNLIQKTCDLCGSTVKDLIRHKKLLHTEESDRKYKCEFCTKAFAFKHILRKHIAIHTNERAYKCRYGCDMAYNDDCNRNSHEKKKHGGLFTRKNRRQTPKVEKDSLNDSFPDD